MDEALNVESLGITQDFMHPGRQRACVECRGSTFTRYDTNVCISQLSFRCGGHYVTGTN